jgi:hypothetical protein
MTPRSLAEKIFHIFQMPLPSDPLSESKNSIPSTAIMRSLESLLSEALADHHREMLSKGIESGQIWLQEQVKEALAEELDEERNHWVIQRQKDMRIIQEARAAAYEEGRKAEFETTLHDNKGFAAEIFEECAKLFIGAGDTLFTANQIVDLIRRRAGELK